jgi:osmotically-inducible protein OsmY
MVTLSGTVGSNQERTKAEHVASKVKGVKKVDTSELKVDTAAHSDSAH